MRTQIYHALLTLAAATILSFGAVPGTPDVCAAAHTESITQDTEDPQAYIEYEKQTKGTVTSRANNTEGVSMLTLSGANTPFKTGDYAHDARFAGYDVLHGIDVSSYQKTIDWTAAKASGVDYAIIRVAYRGYGSGKIVNDDFYQANIEGALAAGVDVGVYIFSQAITEDEAREEAAYVINLVKDYAISLPIVMDFEYASNAQGTAGRLYNAKLTKEAATKVCLAFCAQAEAAGYTGMVYANKSMLNNSVDAAAIASQYPIWLACYPSSAADGAGYTGDYSFWQYTSTGTVGGIEGRVDCNFRYIKKPNAPAEVQNPDVSYTDNTLSWTKVPGVYGYQLYRADSATGNFEKIATLTGAGNISYFDYNLTPGIAYQYKVRAYYKLTAGNRYSAYSPVLAAPTPALSVTSFTADSANTSSITLSWEENPDATGYALYQSTDGTTYTLLTNLEAGTDTYKVTGLKPGKKRYFQLRCGITGSDGTVIYERSDTAPVVLTATKCEAPTNVTAKSNPTSIKLSWDKMTGASGYQIYQYDADEEAYVKLATVSKASTTSYTVKKLSSAKAYRFKVRCYKTVNKKKVYSKFSAVFYTATKPEKVTKLRYSAKKNSVTLSWNKAKRASGYIIYRYNAKTKRYQKIATVKKASYTDKKLSANKSYRYKVVAYKTYKKVTYSASGVKLTAKTRK